jgi:cell wall-associated NlpC family hydrolase
LLQWAYLQAGLVLPRVSSDQWFATTPVPADQMQPGDLLVYAYDVSDADTIHHIAMYIGDGQMVHAPRTGDVVRVVPVYDDGLYGVGRPGV